ncbi:MAG: hypothetical protein LIP28_11010, partial [Deltaproteobacteria bacterium]|nr:hypothetical protein [Deltaproteobacteria bacterium]
MKIYKMQFTSDAYDWLTASEKIPLPVKQSFDGRPKKDSWTPLRVKKMGNKSTSGKALPLGDVPYFDSLPLFVCNKKVLDILSPLLAGNAEILPLIYDKEAYWAVNVTTTLDCVDYDQSRYVSFSSGRIM